MLTLPVCGSLVPWDFLELPQEVSQLMRNSEHELETRSRPLGETERHLDAVSSSSIDPPRSTLWVVERRDCEEHDLEVSLEVMPPEELLDPPEHLRSGDSTSFLKEAQAMEFYSDSHGEPPFETHSVSRAAS